MTSTSLHLVWALPSSEDRNGEIIGYVIDVRALETDVTIQLVSMEESLNITELTPFTTYTLVIAAQTIIGTGPSSEIVTVRTLEDGKGAWVYSGYDSDACELNTVVIYFCIEIIACGKAYIDFLGVLHFPIAYFCKAQSVVYQTQ